MFPVESLSAAYLEDREANAKLLAKLKEQQNAALLAQNTLPRPQGALAQALQQQRPGLFGGMFSGLVKSASGTPTPAMTPFTSRSPTPVSTPLPTPIRMPTQAELESALIAEKRRDADICSMPTW